MKKGLFSLKLLNLSFCWGGYIRIFYPHKFKKVVFIVMSVWVCVFVKLKIVKLEFCFELHEIWNIRNNQTYLQEFFSILLIFYLRIY
jgi:hypothetical protein